MALRTLAFAIVAVIACAKKAGVDIDTLIETLKTEAAK